MKSLGEHRDDEADLVPKSAIASVSLGQPRDFIFRHRDARGKGVKRNIDPVKIELSHGSLLLMNHPTNVYWFHSLPVRKKAVCPRINLTFREMGVKQKSLISLILYIFRDQLNQQVHCYLILMLSEK